MLSGSVRFGSVLGKTWVLVRFVLAWFGFFPVSSIVNIIWCGLNRAGLVLKLARAHLYTILVESESRGGEGDRGAGVPPVTSAGDVIDDTGHVTSRRVIAISSRRCRIVSTALQRAHGAAGGCRESSSASVEDPRATAAAADTSSDNSVV